MTTTEQDKDPGIDEIMHMNIPPEDKVHYIADLAKHRGKCMDEDAIKLETLDLANRSLVAEAKLLRKWAYDLQRSPWDQFKMWLNGWARS
jgi:hypothetical protein